jgi:cycloeucalenol cycloisomerase
MAEASVSSGKGYWFSKNPSKAWGEKFFLAFVPFFIIYNAIIVQTGWLNSGNFWNITKNLFMWLPCIIVPLLIRSESSLGRKWHETYWFKFNLFHAIYIFIGTYFLTEYFFEVLGMRYNFPSVTLYFDSALLGPDESTALSEYKKVPPGMYINAIAFFIVYHTIAIILMRRIRTMTLSFSKSVRRLCWTLTIAATSYFFAWAETFFMYNEASKEYFWYVDIPRQLKYGSIFYALYFIVSFPMVYRMDENIEENWSVSRTCIEALATGMMVFCLLDFWTLIIGPI